jgi:nitroreductase
MAACSEKAIQVFGLDYNKDFYDLPETINSFNALIVSRRSVRAFKDIPVPKDMLEQIVDSLSYAPPSFPPLKIEIVVVQDKQLINKSLPYMINMYDSLLKGLKNPLVKFIIRRKAGPEKFRMIQNHIVPMFTIKLPFMKNGTEDAIARNAQAMILFHADKQSDNHKADIFIALGYGLLRAHSLGLGATAIDLIPPAIERTPYLKQLFQIPKENEVVASMILGYPKHKYKRAIHRQLKIITWI